MYLQQEHEGRKIRDFTLSETFIDEFRDKQPEWGPIGYFVYRRCVEKTTPILCDDLVWRPAGDLKKGQGIIGFDEEAILVKKTYKRYIRPGKVTHNKIETADTVGIKLETGEVIYCTPDHSWLIHVKGNSRVYWHEAKDLLQTSHGNSIYLLRPFGSPWETDCSYEAGYLSAAYDGEGCLDRLNGLHFVQIENPMLKRVENFLTKKNIPWKKSTRVKIANRNICYSIRTYGRKNLFRTIGQLQPPRILAVLKKHLKKYNEEKPRELRCSPDDLIKVVDVFPAGKREVAVLSTNIKTHFTAGFASHNTYSRLLEDGSQEEFWQTCQRVVEGVYTIQKQHCRTFNLPWSNEKAQKSAQEFYQRMWEFKFLPPGRGLWTMGTEVVYKVGSACLNNCAAISTENIDIDFAEPFCFIMDMSMLGAGVGSDVRGVGKVKLYPPKSTDEPFIVEDSREGWVELIKRVLNSFVGKGTCPTNIDYSQIRLRGTPIKTFGGVASGPQPLIELVENLTTLLTPKENGTPITISQIADICNYIGRCVVSGGVRRSSEIIFGDPEDEEFLTLKQDKKALLERRWASNNSVLATVGMDYSRITKLIATNGEPGLFWLENARKYGRLCDPPTNRDYRVVLSNPCSEQSLEDGEMCCLVETFPAHHDTLEDYLRTLKFAYLYTKTVTLLPTHNQKTNAIMMRNRRIGCSISGEAQALTKFGRNALINWCDKGYKYIDDLDVIYSGWLCIPRSIKMTTCKPSGTVSLLCGATPGVHYPIAEYYIRNVRVQKTSPLVQQCISAGYSVEDDKYSTDTVVVSFPVKEKFFTKSRKDLTIWEQFENVAMMQYWWSDNMISATITFQLHEVKDIPTCLEVFERRLKGISLMPLEDHGYEQAPYIPITKEEYEEQTKDLKPIDFSVAVHEVNDAYCSNDTCELPPIET